MRLWLLFIGLCLIGPVLAAVYWQRIPPRPAQVAADGQIGQMAVVDEAWTLLQAFQQRYGHLPCAVEGNASAVQQNLTEAMLAAQSVCESSAALEYGYARGELPWRALGMVKDPKLVYEVPQDAVDVSRCWLSAPARVAASAADFETQSTNPAVPKRDLPSCHRTMAANADVAVSWSVGRQAWHALTNETASVTLPPPPLKNQTTRLVLSRDAQWLASIDAPLDTKRVRWLHWWRLSNDGLKWIAVGRWHIPENTYIHQLAFAGTRIIAAHGKDQQWALADIPLWPHARAVKYHSLPEGDLRGFAALPDGHGVAVKLENAAWQWHALDTAWQETVAAKNWPLFADDTIGASIYLLGTRALSWSSASDISLWRLDADGQWHAIRLTMIKEKIIPRRNKTERQRPVRIAVYWLSEDAAVLSANSRHYLLETVSGKLQEIIAR